MGQNVKNFNSFRAKKGTSDALRGGTNVRRGAHYLCYIILGVLYLFFELREALVEGAARDAKLLCDEAFVAAACREQLLYKLGLIFL